ncbi:SA1362 family protein [Oceanobacillus sp. CFH 90083]|uniref:SA1362 family protein n=1 Tax=Oceanobacillus sp. CFH 90083 TaxID=2592336 RepID=UPI00128D8798|nr:SA1362 family protein [Oceanobacillus sp. CFH 90083]
MRNKAVSIFVYVIVAFAAFGLFTQLFGNTVAFLSRLLISIGIGAVIFGLVYFLLIRRQQPSGRQRDNMKKYKQAVKQSKSKYGHQQSAKSAGSAYQKTSQKKRNPKKASHLRVIEGNKTKKKKRVSS